MPYVFSKAKSANIILFKYLHMSLFYISIMDAYWIEYFINISCNSCLFYSSVEANYHKLYEHISGF